MSPHGTPASYHKGCRCFFCTEAGAEYNRLHRKPYRRLKVSSEPTRTHIAWLNSHGLGNDSIAASCGVGHATVTKIRQRRAKLIYRRTAERILSVTPEGLSDSCLIDASFTKRLIRELVDEGWTQAELARNLFKKRTSLDFMSRRKNLCQNADARRETVSQGNERRTREGGMKAVTEAQTQRACIEFLAAKKIFHMRMQTGSLRNPAGRPVKFGKKGCADIFALLPSGLPLWLEIKAPAKKQRPAQAEFQEEVEGHGHAYMVIHDVNELIHYIDGIY